MTTGEADERFDGDAHRTIGRFGTRRTSGGWAIRVAIQDLDLDALADAQR